MYYMGFTFHDAMNLPIWQRKWFVQRFVTEIESSNTSKSMPDNTPDQRALMGRHREQVPARLRRFT